MRVGLGGIVHETNTYALDTFGPTGLDSFHRMWGDRMVERSRGVRTCLGGFLDGLAELGADPVPLWWASAEPSGTIALDAYESLRDQLLAAIEDALPLDALALDLHGAGVVDGVEDLEGDLGRAIRELVGPELPIVVSLDLHGNITDAMAEHFDVMLGYQLYPHTDMWERGHEAVHLLPALLDGSLRPVTHVEHLPILLPTSTTDPGFPAHAMNEVCRRLEEQPGVVDCTVFHGFPFTDVVDVGVHVVVVTDGDPSLARRPSRRSAWRWRPTSGRSSSTTRRTTPVAARPVTAPTSSGRSWTRR
jgi:microcystin degradation protein MlrC